MQIYHSYCFTYDIKCEIIVFVCHFVCFTCEMSEISDICKKYVIFQFMVNLWICVPYVVHSVRNMIIYHLFHINVRLNDYYRQELLDIIFTFPNSNLYSVPLNTGFCLGNAKEYLRDCTFRLNNECRQNGNFMMKFTPKIHREQRKGDRLTFECENTVWITTRCLSVSRQTMWTCNLSDVRSTTSLIPN